MSYPSAVATSGAAVMTRRGPATGAIAGSTSAISSSLAPAPSARPVLHSSHTPGAPIGLLRRGPPAAGLRAPVAVWHCGLGAGSCCCHVVKQHGPDIPDGYV